MLHPDRGATGLPSQPCGPPRAFPHESCLPVDEFFDDDSVEPAAVELRVTLVNADFAESAGAAQRTAGRVERENPRDQLPETALRRRVYQRAQQSFSGALPASRTVEIDREFRDARVTLARTILGQTGPADDRSAGIFCDEKRVSFEQEQPLLDLSDSARLRFERRASLRDTGVVDPRDGLGITRACRAYGVRSCFLQVRPLLGTGRLFATCTGLK